MNLAKQDGLLGGVKQGRGGLAITHMFFTDDSILFERALMEGVAAIKKVIIDYENMSAQLVNFEKSLIYFSSNVEENIRNQITQLLGVQMSTI